MVNPAPTTTVTLLSAETITLGESVTDTITIDTTAVGTLPAAGGTWYLYVADNVGMTGATLLESGPVSGALPFVVVSAAWTPPSAGDYYFQAVYSGDSNYVGSESVPATEHLVVVSRYAGTVGYWKNHEEAWVDLDPNALFPGTGYTYMEILWLSNKGGDVSVKLAQQYIAALLNKNAFGVPTVIEDAINEAATLLAMYPPGTDPLDPDNDMRDLAVLLEAYNSHKPPWDWLLHPP